MATRHSWGLPFLVLSLAGIAAGQASTSVTIDSFFDTSRLHEIRLEMDPADWQKLKDNYLQDTWYRCQMEWQGMVVKDAAVRSRGSGSRNPIKPGLGIDFSKYVSSQRFLGMKSFVMRNFAQDPSMLHERLAMDMFRKMGLPYLREAHTKLYINGNYEGLFLMVEPIDTRFLTSHFGESDGYLFEFNWMGDGYHWEYLGEDPALYVPDRFEPKNHESDPQPQWIVAMLQAINLSSDAEFPAAVRRYLDMDTFLAHAAVEQFMAEWDGVLGETGTTNFYFYRRHADDRGVLLVWDKEATFTMQSWSVWRNTQRNAVTRRALKVPEFRKHYNETLAAAARVAGSSGGWLEQEARKLTEQIREAAYQDPNRVCESGGKLVPCAASELDQGWTWVRQFAQGRKEFVEGELRADGYQWPASTLEPGSACQAATGEMKLAPGALTRIELARPNRPEAWASGFPLPRELAGVGVRMGGREAPVVHTGPASIVIQVPFELACGPHSLQVTDRGVVSNAITVENRPSRPGIFTAVHGDGALVDAKKPATSGEWIVLYGTGFGEPKEAIATGDPSPSSPPVELKNALRAKIGGQTAKVVWAGFAPGFAGLQQIVLEVPEGVTGTAFVELTMHEEMGLPYEIRVQ